MRNLKKIYIYFLIFLAIGCLNSSLMYAAAPQNALLNAVDDNTAALLGHTHAMNNQTGAVHGLIRVIAMTNPQFFPETHPEDPGLSRAARLARWTRRFISRQTTTGIQLGTSILHNVIIQVGVSMGTPFVINQLNKRFFKQNQENNLAAQTAPTQQQIAEHRNALLSREIAQSSALLQYNAARLADIQAERDKYPVDSQEYHRHHALYKQERALLDAEQAAHNKDRIRLAVAKLSLYSPRQEPRKEPAVAPDAPQTA